jgi:CO/xanthine dehydrogenase FAD-binding subunit
VRSFEYLKPTSLTRALELLSELGPKAKVMAGGTDLMIQWKRKQLSPEYIVSLRNVPELNVLNMDGELTIGSAVTHRTLELSDGVRESFPVISDAVSNLGSVQVRNSATIGGNICNAAPSADTAPPLLVLDSVVRIQSSASQREIAICDFFRGPGRTVLNPDEMVTRFTIPAPLPNTGMAYWKHTRRRAMDLPILGVAVLISLESDLRTCKKARIGLGVAAPTPKRSLDAEKFLEGKELDENVLAEAGNIASGEASPRTTIRGSEWYRRDMIRVLVKRTGLICLARALNQ